MQMGFIADILATILPDLTSLSLCIECDPEDDHDKEDHEDDVDAVGIQNSENFSIAKYPSSQN